MTWIDWVELGSMGVIIIGGIIAAIKISAPSDYKEP